MDIFVKPDVFLISKPEVFHDQVEEALKAMGVKSDNCLESLRENHSSGEALSTVAGKVCYLSFDTSVNKNLTKVTENFKNYTQKLLQQQHISVYRHTNYTFVLTNVSRVLTAELNRHAAGVNPSETSLRYVNPSEGFKLTLVPSVEINETDSEIVKQKKLKTVEILAEQAESANKAYQAIHDIWHTEDESVNFHDLKKYSSLARRVALLGTAVNIVVTANLTAWRNIFNQRITEHAEEEISLVMSKVLKILKEHEPTIFADYDLNEEYPKSGYMRAI